MVHVLYLYFRSSSKDMITTHKEPVMCVKYNKSFKHVVTASESSVSWKQIILCSRLFSAKMAGKDWGKVSPSRRF